jgi:acetyltransferase
MDDSERRGLALDPFFETKSVAIVGASPRQGSIGNAILKNVVNGGFGGPIYPINPRHRSIAGRECVARVSDVVQPVDLAVIATPAASVPEVLEDCGRRGVRGAVILSAGFRETGDAGKALEQQVLETARRHGIRFIGPNCLGVMRPAIGLNATFSQCMAKPGHVALVSQSGAICTAMLDWAEPNGIGFSCVVSSGIASDVDFGEILDHLVDDPETRAVMLYIEGVRDARRFMSALRAAARAKPVIVMKAGRHTEGRRAAVSHTGALVGADDVFDAALKRAGVLRVQRYTDFFAAAETLHMGVRTPGPRIAVVTNGGGPGIVAADLLADKSLPLAELSDATRARLDELLPAAWSRGNPVDVLGDAGAERYADAVRACLDDPNVDAVLAILVPQALTQPEAVAESIAPLAGSARKLLLTCWMGEATMRRGRALLRDRGVATYAAPEAAVEAFAAAVAYRANQELLLQVPEPLAAGSAPDRDGARLIIDSALADGREILDLVESKALLAAFGVPILQSVPAHDATEALSIAEEIGFPVAMKIHSPDISHKSDVNGVRLGIRSGADVRPAFHDLVEGVRARRPDARILGVHLEPMHETGNGRELMLGVLDDPVFGPVIGFGLGGTAVELLRDRAVALPPLNRLLVQRMIDGTRARRFLEAFRGWPPANRRALEEAILRLSEMVCELPWVAELDINPLIVDENRALAVDARVILRRVSPTAPDYAHMAIHPYPSRLVRDFVLDDGARIAIRPIRPEDAVLEREFVNSLSERSRYLRFMYALKEITPEMLSRFTQIDYDREMALIAVAGAGAAEKQLAVARYVDYRDGRGCEFAIVVADEWQGRGIATELLKRLIDLARDRRLETMEGIVLRENRDMIALARSLGFEQSAVADDPKVVLMTLRL